MQNRRVQVGVLVIVLAVLVGYYFWKIVPGRPEPPPPPTFFRVVASALIPRQTVITEEVVRRIQLSESEVPVGGVLPLEWITDTPEVVSYVAAEDIPAGTRLERSMLSGKVDTQGISALIPYGLRAMVVRITRDEPQTIHDLVRIGDRVDIIASFRTSGYTRTLIENIPVLAVDVFTNEGKSIAQRGPFSGGAAEKGEPAPKQQDKTAATMTLGVTPEQAEIIALADRTADLDFTVRGKNESPPTAPSMATTGGVPVTSLLPSAAGARVARSSRQSPARTSAGRDQAGTERPIVIDDQSPPALGLTGGTKGNSPEIPKRLIEVFAPRSRHVVEVPDRSKS